MLSKWCSYYVNYCLLHIFTPNARNVVVFLVWFQIILFLTFQTSDTTTTAKDDAKDFWVNMPNLITHLKKVAEQKPQATYYNVDMLKYQVSGCGNAEMLWLISDCRMKVCIL